MTRKRSTRRASKDRLKECSQPNNLAALNSDAISFSVTAGGNQTSHLDFSRLCYGGLYSKRAEELYVKFLVAHEWSPVTKYKYYVEALALYECANIAKLPDPISKEAFLARHAQFLHQVDSGLWTANSARTHLSSLRSLFSLYGFPAKKWLNYLPTFASENGMRPTQGYSDRELKLLVSALHKVFTQLSGGQEYVQPRRSSLECTTVSPSISHNKIVHAALFLTAFFTGANPTQLYRAAVPKEYRLVPDGRRWFKIEGVKARAGYKEVEYAIGLADYGKAFFTNYLDYIRSLNLPGDSPLFSVTKQAGGYGEVDAVGTINFAKWLSRTFDLVADDGKPLRATVSRLRASVADRLLKLSGDPFLVASALNNTPSIVASHYSTGNPKDNNKELQATAHAMEQSIRHPGDISAAKRRAAGVMGIQVLPRDEFIAKHASISKVTEVGGHCLESGSERSKGYTSKARRAGLIASNESVACADFLSCFFCEHHFIVEEVDDVWCILSFQECLRASAPHHTSNVHFRNNFKTVIDRIDFLLTQKIDKKVVRLAREKLIDDGNHPLWPDQDSVMDWVV